MRMVYLGRYGNWYKEVFIMQGGKVLSDSKLFYDDTKDNKSIYGYIERIRNGDVN